MTRTREELPAAILFVEEVVEGKLGLKLSKVKTEMSNFKRGFRFLGYSLLFYFTITMLLINFNNSLIIIAGVGGHPLI